ncbi:MAG: hypothetical protein HXX18_08135 [Bacteroidetes bacterium]|nr:hypothetical protein [Bacteroidota bacterium]
MRTLRLFTILIVSISFSISTTLYAQNDSLNIKKYWHYRQRLNYFVMPGIQRGQSQIAGIRNRFDCGANDINFGQHGIYFGYYIGMLATEFKLLNDAGDNTAKQTQYELNLALKQYVTYLDKTESLLFKNMKDSLDGFFVRESVPCDFLNDESRKNYFNKELQANDNWDYKKNNCFGNLPKGHPGYVVKVSECDSIPKAFSQDEAIGLLYGLALVYKCMPDSSYEKAISKKIALNVINYIRTSSKKYGRTFSMKWSVFRPNGDKLKANEGGLAWFYAHGFMKAGSYFDSGFDNLWKKITRYPQELFFQFGQFLPSPNADNTTMITTLAVIGDSWRAVVPVIGLVFKMNTSYFGIKAKTNKQDWDTFYALSWNVIHGKNKKMEFRLEKALHQLNTAPYEGPYNYGINNNPKGTGWSASYKWHHKKSSQSGESSGICGNYNGLDFMLLHNLYCIVKGVKITN